MPLERMRPAEPARDGAYSAWHRPSSIGRFIPEAQARQLAMLDLDGVEIDIATQEPVAFIETTERPVSDKQARWTARIAELANVPGYVVQTVLADQRNPSCSQVILDVERFIVLRLADGQQRPMTPQEYAEWLVALRAPRALRAAA